MQTYLSREQDYALRIVAHLMGLQQDAQISIGELSQRLFVPRKFAARIVHKLKHAGIVSTNQGIHGGVYLKKGNEGLSIYDVMNAVGEFVRFNACLDEAFHCELSQRCQFHGFFAEQELKLMDTLKHALIADFVNDETVKPKRNG